MHTHKLINIDTHTHKLINTHYMVVLRKQLFCVFFDRNNDIETSETILIFDVAILGGECSCTPPYPVRPVHLYISWVERVSARTVMKVSAPLVGSKIPIRHFGLAYPREKLIKNTHTRKLLNIHTRTHIHTHTIYKFKEYSLH